MDVGNLNALQGLSVNNQAVGSVASGLRVNGVAVAKEHEAASAESSAQSGADTVSLTSLSASAPASQSATPTYGSGSPNMLARNFASFTRETSKYIEASLNAFRINDMMADAAAQPASTLLDMAGGLFFAHEPTGFEEVEGSGESKYVSAVLKRLEVDRLAKNKKNSDTAEESEKVLEDTRDDIEQAAEEATSPKDADGDVIEEVDADSTAQAVDDKGMPDAGGEADASDASQGVQDMQAKAEKAVAEAVQRADEMENGTNAADADTARHGSTTTTMDAAGGYTRGSTPVSRQGTPLMDDVGAYAHPCPSVDIVV